MTQEIRVAKQGKSVYSTDPNDFIFHSAYNTFKILSEGLLTDQTVNANPKTFTVAHGQSTTPSVYALAKFPDGYVAQPNDKERNDNIPPIGRYWRVEVDGTNVYFIFYQKTGTSGSPILYPGTVSDDDRTGTISWSNTSNATTSNNSYATATFSGAATSHYLKFNNFGFNIPSDATITGVTLKKEGYYSGSPVGSSNARLNIGDSPSGDTKTTNFTSSDSVITEGGSSDLWGNSLTPTIVNSSDFGAFLWTELSSGSGVIYIDCINIQVSFTRLLGNYNVSFKYYIFETPL
jgi:hypothetical protein